MQPPFNIVVKIIEGEKDVYLNTEQAVRIEVSRIAVVGLEEVLIIMSDGSRHTLVGPQAQAFIERLERQ